MEFSRIAVLGGTGFVGRSLVCELTRRGISTRVITRRRERHRELLVNPTCEVIEGDVHALPELSTALKGCDAVINLVGILNETSAGDFERVHAELPEKVAQACRFNRIRCLVHMSALNAAPDAPSAYLKTKAEGESRVHAQANGELGVTSLRPAVIFGPGDGFLGRFATLLGLSPLVFPLACPDSRFAPVYLGDVVGAMTAVLDDRSLRGDRYDLCGPREYRLDELVRYTASLAGLERRVIGLGDGLSRLQASLAEWLPGKPFSEDNYRSLQVDCVCRDGGDLTRLGIEPTALEAIAPGYLGGRRRPERNQRWRRLAGRRA